MQNYEVIERPVTFGMGIELKLSPSQAETRLSSLEKKKNDIYVVTAPVQFKQGEKIAILSDNLSKSVLENLREISGKAPDKLEEIIDKASDKNTENTIEYPCIQHAGFGRYNAFDANGNLLNPKPLRKNEAEKILSKLTGASEKVNHGFERASDENHDINSLPTND